MSRGLRLVWRTDVHQADRGPRSRTDDWPSVVEDKLIQVGRIAAEVEASAVLDGGDFFHNPIPSRSSHALVRRTAALHAAHYPCQVLSNVGNHDVRFGDMRYLPESPLGVLFSTKVFTPCHEGEGVALGEGGIVRVAGVPYKHGGFDRDRLRSLRRGGASHLVVLLHLAAAPRGGQFPDGEEIVSYQEIADLCPEASVFLIGHWHKDQGVARVGNAWVVNCGSVTRGSIAEDDLLRTPKVAVIHVEADSVRVDLRPLQVGAPEAVFDLRAKEQKDKGDSIDRATRLAHMFSSLRAPSSSRSLEDEIRGMGEMRPEVRVRVLDALARGRSNVRDLVPPRRE